MLGGGVFRPVFTIASHLLSIPFKEAFLQLKNSFAFAFAFAFPSAPFIMCTVEGAGSQRRPPADPREAPPPTRASRPRIAPRQ